MPSETTTSTTTSPQQEETIITKEGKQEEKQDEILTTNRVKQERKSQSTQSSSTSSKSSSSSAKINNVLSRQQRANLVSQRSKKLLPQNRNTYALDQVTPTHKELAHYMKWITEVILNKKYDEFDYILNHDAEVQFMGEVLGNKAGKALSRILSVKYHNLVLLVQVLKREKKFKPVHGTLEHLTEMNNAFGRLRNMRKPDGSFDYSQQEKALLYDIYATLEEQCAILKAEIAHPLDSSQYSFLSQEQLESRLKGLIEIKEAIKTNNPHFYQQNQRYDENKSDYDKFLIATEKAKEYLWRYIVDFLDDYDPDLSEKIKKNIKASPYYIPDWDNTKYDCPVGFNKEAFAKEKLIFETVQIAITHVNLLVKSVDEVIGKINNKDTVKEMITHPLISLDGILKQTENVITLTYIDFTELAEKISELELHPLQRSHFDKQAGHVLQTKQLFTNPILLNSLPTKELTLSKLNEVFFVKKFLGISLSAFIAAEKLQQYDKKAAGLVKIVSRGSLLAAAKEDFQKEGINLGEFDTKVQEIQDFIKKRSFFERVVTSTKTKRLLEGIATARNYIAELKHYHENYNSTIRKNHRMLAEQENFPQETTDFSTLLNLVH